MDNRGSPDPLESPPENPGPPVRNRAGLRTRSVEALCLFLGSFAILAFTQNDYGITWDEANPNFPAARNQAVWFNVFLQSGRGLSEEGVRAGFETESDHPSLLRTCWGLSWLFFRDVLPGRVAFALPTSFIASVFCACFYSFLRRRFGLTASLGGTLFLFFHPRWFAHTHFAEYDAPIAMAWWAAAASFYWACGKNTWGGFGIAAFFFSLALSVKLHAFFIPFPFLVWVLATRSWQAWKWAAIGAFLAPALYLFTQPYLWWDTVGRLSGRFLDYSEKLPINVYYLGELYGGDRPLPWSYAWVLLAATLPLGFLFFSGTGLLKLGSRRDRARVWFILLNAITTPLLFTWKAPYDGIRLFLVALPFLAMLAAEGIDRLEQTLRERTPRRARLFVGSLVALLVLGQAVTCARLHPFQLAYYSSLVGGVQGAARSGFETTFWADGLTPGVVESLDKLLPENANLVTHAMDEEVFVEYQKLGLLSESVRFNQPGPATARAIQFRQSFFGPVEWRLVGSDRAVLVENKIGATPLFRVYRGP